MNKINDGGPAFPLQEPQAIHAKAVAAIEGITDSAERDRLYTLARAEAVGGMTLRDYFAAKALHGLIASRHPHHHGEAGPAQLAEDAYLIADAMLFMRGAE